MDYISNTYQKIKIGLTSASGIIGVGSIVIGIVMIGGIGGIVLVAGGVLMSLTSFLILFENYTTYDIINKIKTENEELKKNIVEIDKIKTELQDVTFKANEQIMNLEIKNTEIKRNCDLFEEENERLEKIVSDSQIINNNLTQTNEKLQKNVEDSSMQLENLKKQVDKLKDLYRDSLTLVENLRQAEFGFDNIQSSFTNKFDETKNNFDNIADKMKRLIDNLKNNTFDDLDNDHNGIIDKNEFEKYVN